MSTLLTRSVTKILPNQDLLIKKLENGEKLNVYLGIDPTATRIHVGHAVAIRKLQQFVDEGHNVTFLIGDFTALIGDTSDKEGERPVLTSQEIEQNWQTYKAQASKILDFDRVSVRHNSEWLSKLTFADIVSLCQHFGVGDFVSRELIKKRLAEGKRVGLHETLYPVMQGYDSLQLKTDIQVGGADQTFNMLAGRSLIKDIHNRESFVMITEYLEGLDGRKMSKTWGNAIWLSDTPIDIYGKVMSIPDSLVEQYYWHATSLPEEQLRVIKRDIENDPMNAKKALAFEIVKELHSESNAEEAQEHFEKTFQERMPDKFTVIELPESELVVDFVAKIVGSISQAKRLIKSKAVDINNEVTIDPRFKLNPGDKVKIGKKGFYEVAKI